MNLHSAGSRIGVRRWLGLLLGFLCLTSVGVARAERIRQFQTDVRAAHDGLLDITETIHMDFEDAQRHGIYRLIPVVYDRNGGKYTLQFKLLGVTDENGKAYTYSDARQDRDESIRIGDADNTITGAHTYVLHYTVRRAINVFDGKPEVYWNATGDEWPFPMDSVVTRFYPPPGVTPAQLKTTSFVGQPGSTTPGTTQLETNDVMFSTANLGAGQGLTFVAGLPAGSVQLPGALQNLWWIFLDWWPLLVLPLVALGAMMMCWWMRGRDETQLGAIPVEFSPPKELSPAEVGTLVDERCDMADVVSTLVDLAARGYLRIEEIVGTKIFFMSSKDYRFVKLNRTHDLTEAPLAPHEKLFFDGVFAGSLDDTVLLSSLKNKFYTNLPGIKKAISEALIKKGVFRSDPENVRGCFTGIGVLTGVIGLFLFKVSLAAAGGLLLSGVIIALSAKAMPARTSRGVQLLRQCLAFQRFVSLAERDRIKVLAAEDPTIFGRLLPYAMVLGVADQWANAFRDLMLTPPDWYVSNDPFQPTLFVNNLGSSMNTMGQTFSSAPQSTGGSGGSGFSGGGGGGGFGGGGGGSW